jgi:hypothetical protein
MVQSRSKTQSRREPREARGIHDRRGGHFYINRGSIDIYSAAELPDPHTAVRITRKQLKEALALMDRG